MFRIINIFFFITSSYQDAGDAAQNNIAEMWTSNFGKNSPVKGGGALTSIEVFSSTQK